MSEWEPLELDEEGGLTRRDLLIKGGAATVVALGLPSLASAGVKGTVAKRAAPPVAPLLARILKDQRTPVDTSKFKKSPPYTVGLATQGPFNGWGKMWNIAAEYVLKQSGQVKKVVRLDSNGDPNKQINDMQDLITQKPDLIILTPMSKAALAAPVERAMRAGIPVVLCGSGVTSPNFVVEVGRNLYSVAFDNATALAKRMGGKGNIMMFNGIAGTDTAVTWRQAAKDAFSQFPGIKIVADQFANWSVADSKKAASAILQAQPKIDGVWTGGSEMSIGSILAFVEAGRSLPLFGTTNPLNGFLRLARQHKLKFVGSPYPPAMSALAAQTALDVLHGKPLKKYIDVLGPLQKGQATYTETEIGKHYKPQFNDDYIDPTPVPAKELIKAGFGS